jgi:hypothetical protein
MTRNRSRRGERLSRVLANACRLASIGLVGWAACQPLPEDALRNADGLTIRLAAIDAILEDEALSDDQKRQQLQDLGIEDELLIDALIQGGGTPATP